MPPWPIWFQGRDRVVSALAASWDRTGPATSGGSARWPSGPTASPRGACYTRMPGDAEYRPFALGVLRIEGGVVAETVSFHDVRLFDLFGLPPTLPPVA